MKRENLTIALNGLHAKNDKIYPTSTSKINSKHAEQVILLMISNKEWWHCIAVKKIPALLRRITLKHNGGYYCLNYLHSFRTKNKLSSHKKECEKKDLCNVAIPSIDTNILEFDQHHISEKAPFAIYGDLESLIVKIDGCKNNPEKSSTRQMNIFNHVYQCLKNHHLKT